MAGNIDGANPQKTLRSLALGSSPTIRNPPLPLLLLPVFWKQATIARLTEADARRAVAAQTRVAVLEASNKETWEANERLMESYKEVSTRFSEVKVRAHARLGR